VLVANTIHRYSSVKSETLYPRLERPGKKITMNRVMTTRECLTTFSAEICLYVNIYLISSLLLHDWVRRDYTSIYGFFSCWQGKERLLCLHVLLEILCKWYCSFRGANEISFMFQSLKASIKHGNSALLKCEYIGSQDPDPKVERWGI
jgi:hypothetical protein